MVRLNIIVEGGVALNNISADTANNVEVLRQSLHKFFTRVLSREDLDIIVNPAWGYRSAVKRFLGSTSDCLYIDSDEPPATRHKWFERLVNDTHPEKTILIPDARKSMIFFMVQEMEAWFLKQPDCLSRWADVEGYTRKDSHENIAEHSLLRGRNIEDISKPKDKLKIIMRRYFHKGKKVAKYGELKTAPVLLDSLDVPALIPVDLELQRFISTINTQ